MNAPETKSLRRSADTSFAAKPVGTPALIGEAAAASPLYVRVAGVLRRAISSGLLPSATVLLEGPISELLDCTRAPVRHALSSLADSGIISRFEGRGYLVGSADQDPIRIPLTPDMLSLGAAVSPVRKTAAWEVIYDEVERALVNISVFGRFRVNEIRLAQHFQMGRDVLRSVLTRLEGLGIVDKDQRMRWAVTPLDEQRIRNLYELRLLLEPAALKSAIENTDEGTVTSMLQRTREIQKRYPQVSRTELDELETDLHVRLLQHAANLEIVASLRRTRCILILSKHVLGEALPMPRNDPFLADHAQILKLASTSPSASAACLARHLDKSKNKVVRRVTELRKLSNVPNLPYIE